MFIIVIFRFKQHWGQERDFSVQKIKTQTFKKANLMAELAFPYEVKKCSVQKVVYLVRLFWRNFEEYGSKKQKTENWPKFSAYCRINWFAAYTTVGRKFGSIFRFLQVTPTFFKILAK